MNKDQLTKTSTVLITMFFAHFLVDVMIGIWPIYKTIAHLDLAVTGILTGLCVTIGEGMQIVFGNLGDKGHRKALLLFGLLAVICNTFLAYTENYLLIGLFLLLTCIGSGAFHPSAVAIVTSQTKKRRGLFITIFASGGALGLALSQIIFSKSYFYLKGNTALMALPIILLTGVLYFLHFQTRLEVKPRKFGFQAVKQFFARKELRYLYISQVFNQSLYWGTIFLLPDMLLSRGYDTWIVYGGGHLFFILGGAFMLVPGGYLADRFSPKSVMINATLFASVIFYVLLLAPLSNLFLIITLFFLGSSLGIVNPVAVSFGYRLMPERPGLVSAILMGLVWCIAESIGPGGGGLLTKWFSSDAPAKALGLMGVFFIFGFFATTKLPDVIVEQEEHV